MDLQELELPAQFMYPHFSKVFFVTGGKAGLSRASLVALYIDTHLLCLHTIVYFFGSIVRSCFIYIFLKAKLRIEIYWSQCTVNLLLPTTN
jgi:hypothetical protein